MLAGNYTGHAQKLMLTDKEKDQMVKNYPEVKKLIKKVLGSKELNSFRTKTI